MGLFDGLENGLQGAMGGALGGSALGGWGALGGAGLGLLGGLFGSQGAVGYQDMLKRMASGFGGRPAPQAGPAQQSGYSGFRQNQAGLISQLEAMARGEGPSAATMQMRESMDRAAGAQASAAAGAGGRGVNAGAAMRNAMNNTAAVQAQGARDAANARVGEQLGAINQLSGTIAQGRAADEGTNMFNAGQQNDMARANLQAQLSALGLNDESQLRALMMAMGAAGTPTGTSLMAGGAMAFPSILQYLHANSGMGGMGQPGAPTGFGQYSRNSDGSTGPVTDPSQI